MMLVAVTVSRMDVGSMNVWRTEQYFLAKFVFGKMVTKEKQQIKSKYKSLQTLKLFMGKRTYLLMPVSRAIF